MMSLSTPKLCLKTIAIGLCLALPLSACQTAGQRTSGTTTGASADDQNLSFAQKQLRQEASLFSETSVTGAIGGAVAGGLIGCMVSNCRTGAVIAGAVAGGVAGLATGYFVDAQNMAAANEQDRLRNLTEGARKESERLSRQLDASRTVLNEQKARIAKINKDLKARSITEEQYRKEAVSIQEDVKLVEKLVEENGKTITTVKAEIDKLQNEGAAPSQLASLNSAYNEVRRKNEDLKKVLQALVNANKAIDKQVVPAAVS